MGRSHGPRPDSGCPAPSLTATSVLICVYDHTPAGYHQGGGDYPRSEPLRDLQARVAALGAGGPALS